MRVPGAVTIVTDRRSPGRYRGRFGFERGA
jgi:hypothetical protein